MFAGAMDAVGGGGGLVTVPALLAAGLPPHLALGTNKGQSVFGSFAALSRYAHAGLVDQRAARFASRSPSRARPRESRWRWRSGRRCCGPWC
jgi:uncharacterized membrane protein YfcA